MNIVAHEDDDILFLSPDLLHDVQGGRCVRTVYVTAGDANQGPDYWQSRESGAKAAYAQMAGVASAWTVSDAGIAGYPIPVYTLDANSNISLVFLRLPDGYLDGSGFANNNYQSLQKLWTADISSITALDGSNTFTNATLQNTLLALISSYQPDQLRTQDAVGSYGDGDHSDHHTVAYFVQSVERQYTASHIFTSYQDYVISSYPVNVTGADLTAKQNAFAAYAPYDRNLSCYTCPGDSYYEWLERQYVNQPSSTDLALTATATASSENASTTQTADKAIDGIVDGYPGDYTKEWATVGGGVGSWLKLTWSAPQTINQIVFHDRPNLDDQVTGGAVVFSDGSSVAVGVLNNDGSATPISFSSRTVTSLQFNITSVSATTNNIGLAEIKVYGP